jgi:hypothetical protein
VSRRTVAAAVAALALTSCAPAGSDEARPEPKEISGAAKGVVVKGTGYSMRVPKGWVVYKGKVPGLGMADKVVVDTADRDGFADNVSVILADPGEYDVDRMEATALNAMGTIGASKRRTRRPIIVAGTSTTHVSARMVKGGAKYLVEQYHPVDGDQVYVVTFQFGTGVRQADRFRTAESVLSTWKWTG